MSEARLIRSRVVWPFGAADARLDNDRVAVDLICHLEWIRELINYDLPAGRAGRNS